MAAMRYPSFLLPLCALALVLGSSACTTPLPLRARQALLPADILLLGEQHDAPEHQAWEKDTVQWLAQGDDLAALVLEMAEQGRSTAALPTDASEAAVQKALFWNDSAWPWAAYGPVTMAAVRAGVPVLGGNLPRKLLNAATANTALDAQLSDAAWLRQLRAVREGHVLFAPQVPFRWIDRPPSFMRLLAAPWLASRIFPADYRAVFKTPIDARTQTFFALYFNRTLSAAQARAILQPKAADYPTKY